MDLFEVLVTEHAKMLVSYLAAIVGEVNQAEDLAQEAFTRAYQSFSRFERGTDFGAWVRMIGRNLALKRLGRKQALVFHDPAVLEGLESVHRALSEAGPGEAWSESVEALEDCVRALPEKVRRACELRYYEERTRENVAALLGASLEAVTKRITRGRALIRECVERRLGLQGGARG